MAKKLRARKEQRRTSNVLSVLGLARRAGAVVHGTMAVRAALQDGRALLVVVAQDASAKQLVKVTRLAEHRGVPLRTVARQEELGRAIGVAPVSALAVTEEAFAGRLLESLPEFDGRTAEVRENRR